MILNLKKISFVKDKKGCYRISKRRNIVWKKQNTKKDKIMHRCIKRSIKHFQKQSIDYELIAIL